ncbi:MAG: DUF1822 family protein [Symploca sp. SIO2G7]|nr:DUF1822 family protein [Symploca sp. SIO2G7]
MSVLFDNPLQPALRMPANVAQWHHSQSIRDPAVRWRLYLHQLSLSALMSWFQEEFEQPVCPWPHGAPFDIWHVVDGLPLTLGNRRIVVMLSETVEAADIQIPQEWVDLAGWAADYYIAAYVDVDDERLVLWGYTTHDYLKTRAIYDAANRTYCLKDRDMVQDFSAFWVTQQLDQPVEIAPKSFPTPATIEAESLVQMLVDVPEPRLAVSFSQWAALLSCDQWRQRLYQRRNQPVSIADWLENIFEQGWQTMDSLRPELSASTFRSTVASTAVLTCGKKIFLNKAPDDLLLMFSVDIESNTNRNIRIQLYPSGESLLPSDVVLALELSETGELLKTVKAGSQDNFIQIPPFRCSAGQRLKVHIQLDDSACQEEFIS